MCCLYAKLFIHSQHTGSHIYFLIFFFGKWFTFLQCTKLFFWHLHRAAAPAKNISHGDRVWWQSVAMRLKANVLAGRPIAKINLLQILEANYAFFKRIKNYTFPMLGNGEFYLVVQHIFMTAPMIFSFDLFLCKKKLFCLGFFLRFLCIIIFSFFLFSRVTFRNIRLIIHRTTTAAASQTAS